MARSTKSRSANASTACAASVLSLLCFLGCVSQPPNGNLVQELYTLSSLAARVAYTAELVSAGVTQQRDRIGDEAVAAAERRLRRAYAPGPLERAVLRQLIERWNARHADTALEWLRSRLGRRITRQVVAAASPAGTPALRRFARTLADQPPSKRRLAQARRFEAAANGAEFLVDLSFTTSLGIALALNATLPDAQRADPADLRSDIEARRDGVRTMLGSVASLAFLYSVRQLSDAEVDRSLAFVESAAGRWLERTVSRAYLDALSAASQQIAGPGRDRCKRGDSSPRPGVRSPRPDERRSPRRA